MKLTEEQRDQARKWLEEKWIQDEDGACKCEVCGISKWSVGFDLVMPSIIIQENSSIPEGYPCFLVVCKNCGNSKMFHAVVSNILEGGKEEEPLRLKERHLRLVHSSNE